MKKPSELWASHYLVLQRFQRMCCDHRHQHEQIKGGNHAFLKFGPGFSRGRSLTASRTSFGSTLLSGTSQHILTLCTHQRLISSASRSTSVVGPDFHSKLTLQR